MNTKEKEYTIVWGCYNQLVNEKFNSRRGAWERVKEIMAEIDGGSVHSCYWKVQVWSAREGRAGSHISDFKVYESTSGLCKWGRWGVYTSMTTGEIFG